ncbi:flagellar protein export ATPase FliI [Parendozoicomonas haliclonae]|uniref:Flagellum-specific ATP synthase n=1 Tax=Parendozoicomonas haliclonae TaxID=1960125 RepID=A0A1X7AMU9_9GAMM|nr:flagellar protein export ATPase FliI [Parendozoicomonas haliclonae]SMA49631.1 Flagellum-specific ATP synthase [Parendozoicomonas haliclonae]
MPADLSALYKTIQKRSLEIPAIEARGRLVRATGLTLEAIGCQLQTGQRCLIAPHHGAPVEAEVVGFDRDRLFLMPLDRAQGLSPGDPVIPLHNDSRVPTGPGLLGRVINGAGEPLDGKGPLESGPTIPLHGDTINPLKRRPVSEPLDVGIRAINGLLTVGMGQRLGLFAGSGVGKSVLLGMMTRFTTADVVVVGLIGERGREVREFIEHTLGEEGMAHAVVIAAPADEPPVLRLRASLLCHRVAEGFRDQGLNVLMLMDSLTRYAQAQREIALAIGEPPATKGYPPSVFSMIPSLVERAGNGEDENGSITAFYTVLSEGDDQQDPIADASRAILDGHIVLNRELAESGHYPAIDIEASISRVMPQVTDQDHQQAANKFRKAWSIYRQNKDLLTLGAYRAGSNPALDEAIRLYPMMEGMLQQKMREQTSWPESRQRLLHLLGDN